jgi:hypothetical protein
MSTSKTSAEVDRIIAQSRRDAAQRDLGYRERH